MIEKLIEWDITSFSNFSNQIDYLDNSESYFRKKVKIGKELHLCETIPLQGLSEELEPEF